MTLNIAVIGTGAMGKNHARVYSEMESVNLVGIVEPNEEIGKEIAEKHSTKHYQNHKDLLESEKIDAVSLCVPTKHHKEIAIELIGKKINLLIEKPIASTVEEAEEIIAKAKENDVKLMVGHIERFNPVILELKKRISEGELGKIFLVKSERYSPFPKRILDVGVTIDLAVHDADIIQYLLNVDVESVYATNAQKIHSTEEDLMTATMRLKNGVIGTMSCNWITPKIIREMTVVGEKGMFHANYLTQELLLYKNEFTDKTIDWEKHNLTVTPGETVTIDIQTKEPLLNELEAFIDCIKNNTDSPISGEEGMHSLKIALDFLKAAKNNEVIK